MLRRRPGDRFDAGIADGPIGKGTILSVGPDGLAWRFEPAGPTPEPDPVALIVGLPRPQTARKILADAASLGVRSMHFVRTEKGEPGYADSTLWSSGEWRRHVRAGVEQAFATRIPEVSWGGSLASALEAAGIGTTESDRAAAVIALDNYEAAAPLGIARLSAPLIVAVGPERGWSAAERDLLRARGAVLVHLGPRVLRTETACVAALAVSKARLGLLYGPGSPP